MGDFRKLQVWQESIELCKEVYVITSNEMYSKDFELRGQTRKSSAMLFNLIKARSKFENKN